MTKSAKGTALVTGASSGIGAIYADRLARRGYDLILVARNRERLDGLAKRLAAETGRSIEIVAADLSKRGDVSRIEAILRDNAGISVLVNNAGVGATAPLLASDVDKMSDMIALNVDALMRLTYAAVPGFVARGGGTIVNIASVVGVQPELLNGVYGGSKAFVLALTHSLQHELKDKNVRVQAVLPGATATEFWDIAGTPIAHLPGERGIDHVLGLHHDLAGQMSDRRAGDVPELGGRGARQHRLDPDVLVLQLVLQRVR
ncbi:SDR family NAD(P)-dependent oxidoreductase, partial [Bradyrhizobium sp.]|uniref:SDR family NAD(P)-dependent oxidoreductase n=1 Tax=Bradyrhizobium sp. TaxID=376 RepID=UPI00391B0DC0